MTAVGHPWEVKIASSAFPGQLLAGCPGFGGCSSCFSTDSITNPNPLGTGTGSPHLLPKEPLLSKCTFSCLLSELDPDLDQVTFPRSRSGCS